MSLHLQPPLRVLPDGGVFAHKVRARREALQKLEAESTLSGVRAAMNIAESLQEAHAKDQEAIEEVVAKTSAFAEARLAQRLEDERLQQMAAVQELAQKVFTDGSRSVIDEERGKRRDDGDGSKA